MKRNLKLVTFLLIAVLICSVAISPTAARSGVASLIASRGSQRFDLGASSPTAQLGLKAQSGDQKTPPVSGRLIQTERQDPELAKAFRDYDLIRLDPRAAAAQIRSTGKLSISTSQGNFEIQLALHDMRAADYMAQVITADGVAHKLPKAPVNTYKGIVKGSQGAQARMTVKENNVEGAIITGGERYFIQPARSLSKNTKEDEFVFYRGSDVTSAPGNCGVTLADEVAARASSEIHGAEKTAAADFTASNGPITGLSPLKIARLATEADGEYVTALGGPSQANAQITNIMNLVDGIYQVEIGITLQIAFQNTWADAATDPYISTTAGTLLGQFRDHWNANFTNIQRSLAHLWTGKDLDSGVIGVASLAVVCRSPQFAYGLSQRFPFNPANPVTAQTVVLTAHEMGHNFSAFHTNEPDEFVPPDIEQPCDNTIMEAFVGHGSNFCLFSRSQIIGHANAYGSCLVDSASAPPPFPPCIETSIDSGLFANGTLSAGDCRAPSRGLRHFADRYSFNATAGEQLMITMTKSSGDLDPYLYLIGPDGYVVVQDDDSNGSLNALIPSFGQLTLPLTGKYIIEATSFDSDETGDYSVNVNKANCTLSVSPTNQHFPAGGGGGVINVTTVGSCGSYQFSVYPNTLESAWVNPQISGGSGSQALNFNVQPNGNAAGRRAFLLVGAPSNFGGLRIPITQSGTGPDCSLSPIAPGQTINGDLSTTDCQSPVRGNGFYTDRYTFGASAGQQVAIALSSANAPTIDTFLTLMGPNGVVILTDDDSGGLTNSRIPGGTGMLTLGLPGTYIIEASTFGAGQTGPYTLTLTASATPSTNPLENSDFFVAQHYRDFLERDPDADGLSYWSSQISSCGNDADCIRRRRVGVSAAFFVELEFQRTGSFVYRLYKGGLARRPTYQEFNTDRAQIVEGPNLEADKQALALAFVQRNEFVQKYAGQTTAESFVDALIASIRDPQSSNVDLAGQRPALISQYNTGAAINQSRAFALREAIDSTAFVDAEYNAAFVLMQYFGYLRREPDDGYFFWLNIVNNPAVSNYRSMVCAFITSREYQERFSSHVPRSDSECANIN